MLETSTIERIFREFEFQFKVKANDILDTGILWAESMRFLNMELPTLWNYVPSEIVELRDGLTFRRIKVP